MSLFRMGFDLLTPGRPIRVQLVTLSCGGLILLFLRTRIPVVKNLTSGVYYSTHAHAQTTLVQLVNAFETDWFFYFIYHLSLNTCCQNSNQCICPDHTRAASHALETD